MSDTTSNKLQAPHRLQQANVTQESLHLSTEAIRRKHGHSFPAVTQAYIYVPGSREINDPLNPQEEK
jgi:hypothetical protein